MVGNRMNGKERRKERVRERENRNEKERKSVIYLFAFLYLGHTEALYSCLFIFSFFIFSTRKYSFMFNESLVSICNKQKKSKE